MQKIQNIEGNISDYPKVPIQFTKKGLEANGLSKHKEGVYLVPVINGLPVIHENPDYFLIFAVKKANLSEGIKHAMIHNTYDKKMTTEASAKLIEIHSTYEYTSPE